MSIFTEFKKFNRKYVIVTSMDDTALPADSEVLLEGVTVIYTATGEVKDASKCKVGDGSTTFGILPWIGARDVATVARASTTMSVSANDTSDTITVTASNNQETGLVQGSNATASKTFTLTTSGKTATVSDGTYSISKDVTTAARANTTLSIPAGTGTSFTATAGNNQSTGYVTGSNQTATKTVYLRKNGATVEAASATSGGTVYGKTSVTSGSATTPATTITSNPTISVSSAGVITTLVSATKSVTPTVSAGYVSSGTSGTITVSGSGTKKLSTQAAKTITPTSSSQTAVAAGKYTTGAVTVAAVPTETLTVKAYPGGNQVIEPEKSGHYFSKITIDGWSYATSMAVRTTPGSYSSPLQLYTNKITHLEVKVDMAASGLSSDFITPWIDLTDILPTAGGTEKSIVIGANGYSTYLFYKADRNGKMSFKVNNKAFIVSASSTSATISSASLTFRHSTK